MVLDSLLNSMKQHLIPGVGLALASPKLYLRRGSDIQAPPRNALVDHPLYIAGVLATTTAQWGENNPGHEEKVQDRSRGAGAHCLIQQLTQKANDRRPATMWDVAH